MSTEIWKSVIGYEGKYEVSNLGNIKSLNYRSTGKNMILKKGKYRQGYEYVIFVNLGKRYTYTIHRLLAIAFIKNPDSKPYVNHINGIKNDNRVENLEWCTASENTKHSYSMGLQKVRENNNFVVNHYCKGKFGKDSHSSKIVLQFDINGIFIREIYGFREAERITGILRQAIYNCCNGKSKTSGGYIWKYKIPTE